MIRCACLTGRIALFGLLAAMAAVPAPAQESPAAPVPEAPAGPAAPGAPGDALLPGDGDSAPGPAGAGGGAGTDSGEGAGAGTATGADAEPVGATVAEPGDAPRPPPVIVTLDQERLFRSSAFGKAALARAEAAATALTAENRRIEGELEAEEKSLTERRATLAPDEFAALARDFDTRVEQIRREQDEKSRAIGRALDADRGRFFEAAGPVLVEMLGQTGALAILSDTAVILSLSAIDVTDEAIARMDAAIGAGDEPDEPEAPANP